MLTTFEIPVGTDVEQLRFELPEPQETENEGCTLGKGYWANHAGQGPGNLPDEVSALLPLWLGDPEGEHSVRVEDAATALRAMGAEVEPVTPPDAEEGIRLFVRTASSGGKA